MVKKQKAGRRTKSVVQAAAAKSGAPRLFFPQSYPPSGFSQVNQSNKESPGIVREILQNSLDAATEANRISAEVDFFLEDNPIRDIPGIDDYREAVDACDAFCAGLGWQGQDRDVVNNLKSSLRKKTLPVLFVADNGIGLGIENMNAILSDGVSIKKGTGESGSHDRQSSGSHGNGHFTVFGLSRLRYLLYGGVSAEGKLASGQAVLRSHQGANGASGGNGFFVNNMNSEDAHRPYEFAGEEQIPPLILKQLRRIESKHGTGAITAVLDFNYFGLSDASDDTSTDLILGAAARNFFVAIGRGKLKISVKIGGTNKILTADNLAATMQHIAPLIGSARGFPRQDTAQRFYKLFCDCQDGIAGAKIDSVKTESGTLQIYYRQGQGVNATDIALCRNGMWITKDIPYVRRRHFAEHAPFEALILCDATPGEQLPGLIRDAETNLHNAINIETEVKDSAKQEKLISALNCIKDKLRELIRKQDSEALNFIEVEGIGLADTDRPGRRMQTGGIIVGPTGDHPGSEDAEKGKPRHRDGMRSGAESDKKPSSPKPGRQFRVKCVAVRNGDKMRLRIVPTMAAADVELRLALSGGGDISCDNPTADDRHIAITSIRCNGKECEVANDGTARIGEVAEGDEKNIEVQFKAPPVKDKNYKVECEFVRRAAAV